jgi:hypothetical protein
LVENNLLGEYTGCAGKNDTHFKQKSRLAPKAKQGIKRNFCLKRAEIFQTL